MPISTAAGREAAAAGFAAAATRMSAHTADPVDTGANEVVGGSYARKTVTWTADVSDGVYTAAAVDLDIPAEVTVTHVGLWTSAGVFLDAVAIEPAVFPSTGILKVSNVTYTQS